MEQILDLHRVFLEYGALTESSSNGIRAAILSMVFEAAMVQTLERENHSLKMVLYSKLMCTVYVRYDLSNFHGQY